MKNQKTVCCLYRTEHMLSADRLEMERQRSACLQYAEEHSWTVLREFWAREDHMDDPENMDDPLMELCAGAKGRKFDLLLVSKFDRLGRIPGECSFAAAFFERHGVEVWETADGHIGAYVREW